MRQERFFGLKIGRIRHTMRLAAIWPLVQNANTFEYKLSGLEENVLLHTRRASYDTASRK